MANAIFIFNVHRCAACGGEIEEHPYATWRTTINGVEHRFPFCAVCIDGEPTDERCRELVRRMIGFEDSIAHEEVVKHLIEDLSAKGDRHGS